MVPLSNCENCEVLRNKWNPFLGDLQRAEEDWKISELSSEYFTRDSFVRGYQAREKIRMQNEKQYIDVERANFIAFEYQLGIEHYDGVLGLNKQMYDKNRDTNLPTYSFIQMIEQKLDLARFTLFL